MAYCDITDSHNTDPSFQLDVSSPIYTYNTQQIDFNNEINDLYTTDNSNIDTKYVNTLTKLQWNTYYYKKYKEENKLLYFIMIMCIIVIILTLIKNQFHFFDENAYSIIIGIILLVSVFRVLYSIWKLFLKDNINFDENDYLYNNTHMFNANGVTPTVVPMPPTKNKSSKSCK